MEPPLPNSRSLQPSTDEPSCNLFTSCGRLARLQATFADVPIASGSLFKALLQYAGDYSDGIEQMWSNPDDHIEPESDTLDDFFGDDDSSCDGESMPHLSKTRPRTPRFELGPGCCMVPYETDKKGTNTDVFVMHYLYPIAPTHTYGSRIHLYRACAIGVAGRGKAEKHVLKDFCKHVLKWKSDLDERRAREGRYMLFRCKTSKDGERVWWSHEGMKVARSLDKVYLPLAEKESLIADMTHFLDPNTKRWYLTHGLPYRRSYLLYGPPGTGKSTTIRATAGKFRL